MPTAPTDRKLPEPDVEIDPPPILGSWRNMYTFVLVLHFFLLLAFYFISRAYTY